MELSYQTLKVTHQAREASERRAEARRKNLLILILHYLTQEGYIDAANALEQETEQGLQRFEVCDNVDLETILMEYESYYFVKFQKYPKIVRKAIETEENKIPRSGKSRSKTPLWICGILCFLYHRVVSDASQNLPRIPQHWSQSKKTSGKILEPKPPNQDKQDTDHTAFYETPDFGLNISGINKGIGGENAHPRRVRLLKPLSAFIGMNSEMRELAAVVSRVLFELARYHAPSTIFLDELESVMSQRGTALGGEHEGSLRMKTELLMQMDGLARSEDLVFVLAASNQPWELDCAMLRRLEKRILVDLPSKEARQAMICHWLPAVSNSGGVELRADLEYGLLSQETEGYSGSDIKLVCKEAAMRSVRKIFNALENLHSENSNLHAIRLDTVTTADFLDVMAHTKPSVKNLIQKYSAWQRDYESV
ncbi:katanin p60 ATPase-containing subunit A-like 2 isoform X3 [Vombatus ursinus]|uniref:katanin p60 ATPase-containing subunit A-like 2 isoform X3 n=1 Tax=Vombatus ursinus TaxID=29139 RepID=UPI000FFD6865|nr:katanin p60 ATPase-containing subunit A-like 2 isoform X3 [Vombatus ursinus]